MLRGVRFDDLVEVASESSNPKIPKLLEWADLSYQTLQISGHMELDTFLPIFWNTVCAGHDLDRHGAVPSTADMRRWLLSRSTDLQIPGCFNELLTEEQEFDRQHLRNNSNVQRWIHVYEPGANSSTGSLPSRREDV